MQDIHEIKVVQAEHGLLHQKNTDDLERHILRTDLAEKRIEMLYVADAELKEELIKELTPIKTHVAVVNASVKVLILMGSAFGGLIAVLKSLGILDKLF